MAYNVDYFSAHTHICSNEITFTNIVSRYQRFMKNIKCRGCYHCRGKNALFGNYNFDQISIKQTLRH